MWTAVLARINIEEKGKIKNTFECEKHFLKLEQYYGKLHVHNWRKNTERQEDGNFVLTSDANWELSCQAINLKLTPVRAQRTQLSGWVSYYFVLWVNGAPSQINYRVSKSVFSVSSHICTSVKINESKYISVIYPNTKYKYVYLIQIHKKYLFQFSMQNRQNNKFWAHLK